jgi:hypothetical protein
MRPSALIMCSVMMRINHGRNRVRQRSKVVFKWKEAELYSLLIQVVA